MTTLNRHMAKKASAMPNSNSLPCRFPSKIAFPLIKLRNRNRNRNRNKNRSRHRNPHCPARRYVTPHKTQSHQESHSSRNKNHHPSSSELLRFFFFTPCKCPMQLSPKISIRRQFSYFAPLPSPSSIGQGQHGPSIYLSATPIPLTVRMLPQPHESYINPVQRSPIQTVPLDQTRGPSKNKRKSLHVVPPPLPAVPCPLAGVSAPESGERFVRLCSFFF